MPLYIPRKLWFSTRSGEIRSKFSPAALKIGIISKYFGWECDQNPRLRACVILANFHFCVVSFVWTGSKYISEEAGAVFHDILCYGHPTFCLGVATFYWMSIFDFSAFRGILTGFLNLKTLKTQLHSHLISSFFTAHFINFWPSNNRVTNFPKSDIKHHSIHSFKIWKRAKWKLEFLPRTPWGTVLYYRVLGFRGAFQGSHLHDFKGMMRRNAQP